MATESELLRGTRSLSISGCAKHNLIHCTQCAHDEHVARLERELASLRAEKERLEETQRKFGLWQHELMQRAERAEAKLKAQAAEAYADVDEWAAYASEYFKAKWDLHGTLQKWRDRFEPDAARKGEQ